MIAPGRAKRPGARRARLRPPTDAELRSCPFCRGREKRTPPETFFVGHENRRADERGKWLVRVVPNLFPALDQQEVVIHSPRHVWTLADFSEFPAESSQLSYVARAWQHRAEAARKAGLTYLHAFINEGRLAGASLGHSHSQLAGWTAVPPEVSAEMDADGECRICSVLNGERREGTRVVAELHGSVVAVCPYAGRVPYEILIGPARHETDGFGSKTLSAGLSLLAECMRRLHRLEGRVPFNAWLHTSPFVGDTLHWHIHLVPRLTVFAGLELGAGLYVNELRPERAAQALRGHSSL